MPNPVLFSSYLSSPDTSYPTTQTNYPTLAPVIPLFQSKPAVNQPVNPFPIQLLLLAAGQSFLLNRMLFVGQDVDRWNKTKLDPKQWKYWKMDHINITPPSEEDGLIRELLCHCIRRWLGWYASIQLRKVFCYRLVALPGYVVQESVPANAVADNKGITLSQQPINDLITALNRQYPGQAPKPIFIDETGITQPVSLHLEADVYHLANMQQELKAYGLVLQPVRRHLEMLLLSDTKITSSIHSFTP